MMKYGLKLSIFPALRDDEEEPEATLEINAPEVGEECFAQNPALEALRQNFELLIKREMEGE